MFNVYMNKFLKQEIKSITIFGSRAHPGIHTCDLWVLAPGSILQLTEKNHITDLLEK
jgi:hypothetical protein